MADRVTVWRALRDGLEAHAAVGAATIVDHDGLPEGRLDSLRHGPRDQIGAATWWEADHDAHRTRRVILAPGRGGGHGAQSGSEQAAAIHGFLQWPTGAGPRVLPVLPESAVVQAASCSMVGAFPA